MFFCTFTVITGGSEGIGLAFARELAKRKLNIILIARNKDKLNKAAAEIGNFVSSFCYLVKSCILLFCLQLLPEAVKELVGHMQENWLVEG